MWQKTGIVIQAAALALAAIFSCCRAAGQNASTVSLAEQLQAQYQLVKLGSDANGTKVLEPGTVLVIQKDGIFGVPPASTALCSSRYQDGKLDSPDALCPATLRNSSRSFKVGEKAYPSKIAVDVKNEKISFDIIACDACNGTNPPSSFRSEVIFQFAKGYLEKASVPEVEDIIAQVFDIYTPPETPPAPLAEGPGPAPAPPGQGLTNDDIIKLVQVKLSDSLIITKIKSSACAFDTGTDALIKLKQAGAGDAVLQAMIAAASAPPTAPAPPSTASGGPPAPAPSASAPSCGDYDSCFKGGLAALQASRWASSLSYFQAASSMDPSKPDAWAESGKVYLAAGQYKDAVAMWDKALGVGGTLALDVWALRGMHHEKGIFSMSAKEVSYVGQGKETLFSVAPAEVTKVTSAKVHMSGGCWWFCTKVGGKNHCFYHIPLGAACEKAAFKCEEPGPSQMEAVANYVAQTIGKLAPGSLSK